MLDYNINTVEGRKVFISNYPSGYYSGADEQRNDFVITLTQGVGMKKHVYTPDSEYTVYYDSNGEEFVTK